MTEPVLDVAELTAFLARVFPQAADQVRVEHVGPMSARMRLLSDPRHLRPGGTVSGPSMALLGDVCFYAALLGQIGEVPLAVTTNMSFSFLRKPVADADLLCDARILKLGRLLASGDALLYSDGGSSARPVANATFTYALPPKDMT